MPRHPIAEAIIEAAGIPPEQVRGVSYYLGSDGEERASISIRDPGDIARELAYRLIPDQARCSNCQFWGDRISDDTDRARCTKLVTDVLTASTVTPREFSCSLWEPVNETSWMGYQLPESGRTVRVSAAEHLRQLRPDGVLPAEEVG